MKKLIILLFIILVPVLHAQEGNTVLDWKTDHGLLHFPHALYADGENTLPYYSRKIPWEESGKVPGLELRIKASSKVDASLLAKVDADQAKNKPVLEYSLAGEAGRTFLIIKLLPFFLAEDGSLWKLEEFELLIEAKPALAALKFASRGSWAGESVLASGSWYRIAVRESGMHRLSYEQLEEIGLENPAAVRIYGSGARQVPEAFSRGSVDDLSPLPLYMDKGSDKLFGPGDFLLFNAEGPVSWSYDQENKHYIQDLHNYSDRGYYFLTDSKGPSGEPSSAGVTQAAPDHIVVAYDHLDYLEEEDENLLHSGREWFGDAFKLTLNRSYPFQIPDLVAGDTVRARIAVAARSGQTSRFRARINNENMGSLIVNRTDLSHYTATYAYQSDSIFKYSPSSDVLTITLSYEQPDNDSEGWLNYISLNARSRLDMDGKDQLAFRDSRSAGFGQNSRFQLENASETVVWDVTDPGMPLDIPLSMSGQEASFTLETEQIREFIAFRPQGSFPAPEFKGDGLGAVDNQNLHGMDHPDMVILTTEIFLEEAERLAAHRRSSDGLKVEVVLQQEVFNEFSSGTPDISAIRNFMKMFYDRAGNGEYLCRYLLLFGDGTFDNRGSSNQKQNSNLLLTYQSPESLAPTRSFTSDDFFGLLDTDEAMYNGLLDIGIGRLPVSTVEEAGNLVDKFISYDLPENQGKWRNQICFIGDDEDGNIHMRQADELARYVNDHYAAYNINKIYLDAYSQHKSATGFTYPDALTSINQQVNRGALILNYTGHGGKIGLAHEKVVTKNSIASWSNKNKLPLFMTATCEFSRYDEYDIDLDEEITTAGEDVLLSNEGGGIGLFTTTRLVYSGPNHTLNERFYEVVFEKDQKQENYRLGDIIAYSKNNTGPGVNKRNFTLLGDPSLKLSYPEHQVVTDSINGSSVLVSSDTLSAFDWVSVSGHMETDDGSRMDAYEGYVYPVVFDKARNVETLSNDDDPVFRFTSRSNILYSGKVTVTEGEFNFGFYVPKDIAYAYGPGKISYYSNDSLVDAHGSWEDFSVGGIGTENAVDLEAPEMDLYMNDTFFVSGGITDDSPYLLVHARDNMGINTTGNGIGHDLTATMDGNRVKSVILNEFYQANINSHNSGIISYPYTGLGEGRHEITVKIWDIHNNSSEKSIDFVVVTREGLLIEKLFSYPNPFTDYTLFNIEHNRPDSELKLTVDIYDMKGAMVHRIEQHVYSGGYRLEPVRWDGSSTGGRRLGAGMYIYRVSLRSEDGELAADSGKLIMLE